MRNTTSATINRGKPFRKHSYTSEDMMDHFDIKEVISGTGGHEVIYENIMLFCWLFDLVKSGISYVEIASKMRR